MTFLQLHERLRIEIARRIDRGQLTGTLLARQTGLRASHLSNFIRRKRKLSLPALDRVLSAQVLSIEDLVPEANRTPIEQTAEGSTLIPLVSNSTAIHSAVINGRSIIQLVHLPSEILDQLRPRRTIARREWHRFVAVRPTTAQAEPMTPLLRPGSILILDRHYNSLAPYHTSKPNIYAVNAGSALQFRYVSYDANRVILRPHSLAYPVELLRLGSEESPSGYIVGRVCLAITEL
jgi:hypothetical protein